MVKLKLSWHQKDALSGLTDKWSDVYRRQATMDVLWRNGLAERKKDSKTNIVYYRKIQKKRGEPNSSHS